MMSADELMDARLAEVGERWREANASAAEVDFASLGSPAAGDEIPVEFPEPPRHRSAPAWRWIAGVAALVVVVAGITVAVRIASDKPAVNSAVGRGAADSAATALLGTSWTLANFTPAGGETSSAVHGASIAFGKDGSVSGEDGCAGFTSASDAARPAVTGSAPTSNGDAHGRVTFGVMSMPAVGCIDQGPSPRALFDSIVMSTDPASWTIYGGSKLALHRDGVGTLVFVRTVEPDRAGSPLIGTAWRLDTIEQGSSASTIDWVEGSAPRLSFAADGTVDGFDSCHPVHGTYTIDGASLELTPDDVTATACGNGYAGTIDSVLTAPEITWKISGTVLRLTAAGTTLVFVRE
jgi:heat shock protein HslJ